MNHQSPAGEAHAAPLVQVRKLRKAFPIFSGIFQRKTGEVRAVEDVSFEILEGQTFGLVGESGCGKTTAGKAMLRIIEPTSGEVIIDGEEVTGYSQSELRKARRKMQMIFQDPTSSLNPRQRIGQIVKKPMKVHDIGTPAEREERVDDLLETAGIPIDYKYRYPTALSGGQKQRVGIARALTLNPQFIVLDEPTSALDVSVQARIVDLLDRLQDEYGLTYLFITHDLSLIRNIADRIGVMYLGELVETGPTEAIFSNPQHPYTQGLLSSIPTVSKADERVKPPATPIEGEIPDPRDKPSGCPFRTRCPKEFEPCDTEDPSFYNIDTHHAAKCFLHDDAYQNDEAG